MIRLAAHPIGAMIWLKQREGRRLHGRAIRVESVTCEVADLTRNENLNDAIPKRIDEVEAWVASQ